MITACGFAVLCFRIAETFHIFAAYYFQDMNLTDAIPLRHSVRSYTEKPVETEKLAILESNTERISPERLLIKMDFVSTQCCVPSGSKYG